MNLLGKLLGFDSDDSDDQDWTITNENQRRSGVNPHPADTYFDPDVGLTKHENEILQAYILHNRTEGAKLMGMNRDTFYDAVQSAKEKLDWHGIQHNRLYKMYKERYGTPQDSYVDDTDYTDVEAPEQTDTYDDPNAPTIRNPWSGYFDIDGNYIE